MVYGSISTQKPRATRLFSSSLPRNKPTMTRQTSHAHATRCIRSDFNLCLLCTTFAVQLQTYSKIACCLQFNCKHAPKLHFICGSPANMLQNCIFLAELPQIQHKTACCLQFSRKYNTKLHDACGTSANMLQNCMLLAVRPQIYYKTACYLRNSRKYNTKLYVACGASASNIQKCASFAEVPQMMRKMKRCSSQSAQIPRAIVLHHRHNNLL